MGKKDKPRKGKTRRQVTIELDAFADMSDQRVVELLQQVIDVGMADAEATRDMDADINTIKEAADAWSLDIGTMKCGTTLEKDERTRVKEAIEAAVTANKMYVQMNGGPGWLRDLRELLEAL